MFPGETRPPPPVVDIRPRAPVISEIRVIVYEINDLKVKNADIYVKASIPETAISSRTDVDNNVQGGIARFNYRLILRPLHYNDIEKKLLIHEEEKEPALLLQVFSKNAVFDQCKGELLLPLTKIPFLGREKKTCRMLSKLTSAETFNIFNLPSTPPIGKKGYWPLEDSNGKCSCITKLEF